MSNDIMNLVELTDSDSEITENKTIGNKKIIRIEKIKLTKYCIICGSRLYSKGKFARHPNNQIFQGGYILDVTLVGRRWKCSNPDCDYTETDQFPFIERYKHNTLFNDMAIINELKDINKSCRQVARMYNVSDTYVHTLFLRYVSPERLRLPSIISIDEVYLNISYKCKYALVIMDWCTGDIIDILPSRRKEITEQYFLNIPRKEREQVRYLICDMYDPYVNYTKNYFDNSICITDSFHVLQWLLRLIRNYINNVKKKYQERDRKALAEKNRKSNTSFETAKESREVYILKHGPWVILKNEKNFKLETTKKWNKRLGQYMDRYDWEREFMALDPNFRKIKFYKDMYETFNGEYINDLEGASARLDELIGVYKNCDIGIFREFAQLLRKYHDTIVNSFTYVTKAETERHHQQLSRLSNGPMESFNNIPSGYRTQSHGVDDFEFTRNRILWSVRKDPPILGNPKTAEQVHHYTGKKRKPYKKHSSK